MLRHAGTATSLLRIDASASVTALGSSLPSTPSTGTSFAPLLQNVTAPSSSRSMCACAWQNTAPHGAASAATERALPAMPLRIGKTSTSVSKISQHCRRTRARRPRGSPARRGGCCRSGNLSSPRLYNAASFMCGVIGFISEAHRDDLGVVAAELLKTLEYRGYDSTGAAVQDSGESIVLRKGVGAPSVMVEKLGIT